MADGQERLRQRNRRMVGGLFAVVFGMVGLAYASVPLYTLFCQITGFGGTTMRADAAPGAVGERVITVRFNADVNPGLPWAFRPVERSLTVRLGEMSLASYRAENRGETATVGTASYNVTPDKVGRYFNKIECFCFTEQVLEPGRVMDMPVAFFVDPALADDPAMADISTITLSYSFFRVRDTEATLAQRSDPGAATAN